MEKKFINFFKQFNNKKWIAIDVEGTALTPYAVGFGLSEVGVYTPRSLRLETIKPFKKHILVGCGMENDISRLKNINHIEDDQIHIDIQLLAKSFGIKDLKLSSLAKFVNESKKKSPGLSSWSNSTKELQEYLSNDVRITAKIFQFFVAESIKRSHTLSRMILRSTIGDEKQLLGHIKFNCGNIFIPVNHIVHQKEIWNCVHTKYATTTNIQQRESYILELISAWKPDAPIVKVYSSVKGKLKKENIKNLSMAYDVMQTSLKIEDDDQPNIALLLTTAFMTCNTLNNVPKLDIDSLDNKIKLLVTKNLNVKTKKENKIIKSYHTKTKLLNALSKNPKNQPMLNSHTFEKLIYQAWSFFISQGDLIIVRSHLLHLLHQISPKLIDAYNCTEKQLGLLRSDKVKLGQLVEEFRAEIAGLPGKTVIVAKDCEIKVCQLMALWYIYKTKKNSVTYIYGGVQVDDHTLRKLMEPHLSFDF
eukprot:NODE_57_length_28844_cov_0.352687.p7 type:complete len:475 gc:universal NODE_57_length_28844_cov_0.352687:26052-27476(+)